MKLRGIVSIEYEMPNDFLDGAEEETKLAIAISKIVNGNKRVTFHEFRIDPISR